MQVVQPTVQGSLDHMPTMPKRNGSGVHEGSSMPTFFVNLGFFRRKCQKCDNLLGPRARFNAGSYLQCVRKRICVRVEAADGWRCTYYSLCHSPNQEPKFLLPSATTLIIDEDYLAGIIRKREGNCNQSNSLHVCPRCGFTTAPTIKAESR